MFPLNKCLLDTDIYSEILKSVDQTVLKHAVAYRQAQGVLTLTTITVMEVIRGFHKILNRQKLQGFLSAIAQQVVLDFDRPSAELAGRIAGDLERVGQPIGPADTMIAAIALTHQRELVTGNTAHFARIQQLGYPLMLANWRQ